MINFLSTRPAPPLGVQGRSLLFADDENKRMDPKPHKTYPEQLDLLRQRGMHIADDDVALALLQRVGYYTLSGYSYSSRLKALDGSRASRFRPGTSYTQVAALWEFVVAAQQQLPVGPGHVRFSPGC